MVLVSPNHMIIIADDDRDDQSFMKAALENANFSGQVRCVGDGNQLLDFLNRHEPPPALILLDLNMPYKSGYEALAEIKNHPGFRAIPTVILTSSTNISDEHQCYQLGCDDFIRKPMSMDEYQQVANSVLCYLDHHQGGNDAGIS